MNGIEVAGTRAHRSFAGIPQFLDSNSRSRYLIGFIKGTPTKEMTMRLWVMMGLLLIGLTGGARAGVYEVRFTGTYNSAAPVTLVSAPGAAFDISFQLPDPYPYASAGNGGEITTALTYAQVLLGGVPSSDRFQYVSLVPAGRYIGILFQDDQASLFFDFATTFFGSGMLSPFEGQAVVSVKPNGRPEVLAGNVSVSATMVPEPGTMALLGMGAAGVIAATRRRKIG